jgi:hypothetical protein
MEQLRVERRAVMSLIAEQQRHESACSAGALSLACLEIEAAPAADTTAAADAASVEVLPAPSGDVLPLVAG